MHVEKNRNLSNRLKNLKKSKPNWMGNFHNNDYFSCSNYYQYLKKWITQKNYCMILLGELLDSKDKIYEKFGKNDLVFIRPNSGEKEFNGELVHKNMFSNWKEMVKESLSISDDILCIVSEPVDIDKETRIVIVEGKAVTGSYYRVAKHIHREEITGDEWEKCASFAEMVIGFLPNKPPFFVVDIATKSDTMSIMEIGCFCCAGLYECDVKKIAEAISVSAEKFAKGKINDI
jgi:hypothetical protein